MDRTTTAQICGSVKSLRVVVEPTNAGGLPNCWARPNFWIDVTICQIIG